MICARIRTGLLYASLGIGPCATGCRAIALDWPWSAKSASQPAPTTATATATATAQNPQPAPADFLALPSLSPDPVVGSLPPPTDDSSSVAIAFVPPTNLPTPRISVSPNTDPAATPALPVAQNRQAMPDSLSSTYPALSNPALTKSKPEKGLTEQLTPSPAPSSTPKSNLTLQIDGVQPGGGDVKIALFTRPTNFPDSRFAHSTVQLPATAGKLTTTLPPTTCLAIAVYQDTNRDGTLSRNRFGIPSEPYGFSNSAESHGGPPSFEEAAIDPDWLIGDGLEPITIQLR